MTYLQFKSKYHNVRQEKRKCKWCKNIFYTKSKGLTTAKFCSYKCANNFSAERRKLLYEKKRNKKYPPKICLQCGNKYSKPANYGSLSKWWKRGALKQGTPEWLEKIRSTTKDAMLKPEINFKIRQKRSPLSIKHRIAISNKLAGKLPKNMMFGSNNFPNVQRGDYDNSKGTMYFRSKWEANYALYLDFLVEQKQIKSWEYEADIFVFDKIKFGTRSYRPDFKIINNDDSIEYHEVKGYMDSKSKTKLKRMLRYYPEIKLILIDTKSYNDIKKKIGKTLNFY